MKSDEHTVPGTKDTSRSDRIAELKSKAKFRLRSAHFLPNDIWLPGDNENIAKGDEMGSLVGAGTPYQINWPTLEMEPLNEEAKQWLELERQRLTMNDASMNPIDDLPVDDYEANYIPGLNLRRKAPAPDGTPIRS